MMAAATACLVVILVLTADFIYARANSAPPSSTPVTANGQEVRVPLSQVDDGKLHLFTVNVANQTLRFMIIKKPDGDTAPLSMLAVSVARKAIGRTAKTSSAVIAAPPSTFRPSAIRVAAIPSALPRTSMAATS